MKGTIRLLTILLLTPFLLVSGCRNAKESEPIGPAAAVQTNTFQAVGTVKGIDPKEPIVEVDHENIPGLMPAMQMQFHVKDRTVMEGLKVGDRINFTVEHGVGGLKITAIAKQ